jgi:hypothetical protein
MGFRPPLCLGVLLLALAPAAQATPACDQIACHLPPTAHCSDECLTCYADGGTEYMGDTCDHPTLITVGDIPCPCVASTFPDFLLDLKPGSTPTPPAFPGQPAVSTPQGAQAPHA